MNISYIPRMRTLPEALKMLKELDSSTAITLRALRRMVNNGEIPVVMVGSKRLINFDKLLERLNVAAEIPHEAVIRRVDEKMDTIRNERYKD